MQGLRRKGIRQRMTQAFTGLVIVTIIVGAVGVLSMALLERTRDAMLTSGAANADIMAASREHILFTSVIMVAVLVVGVIIAVVAAQRISRSVREPLEKLLHVVQQVGTTGSFEFSDEFKKTIRDDGGYKDELGLFSHNFAKMMDDIMEKVEVLERAATGDLTVLAPSASPDDTLANATNELITNLNTMTREVRTAVDQLSAGIAQISQGAQSLAQSTMQQSATMEGLMRTLGEVSHQAEDNARHSKEASDITTSIWGSAEEGRASMDKMTQAMTEINAASKSISSVMKAIDDIAFQTNILSLNAAVEAARAGQHGRGFAVVADEVRNLATKSASAAKDSADLISDTVTKTGIGTEIAQDTSEYLNKIMNGVSESTWLLKNIATATAEQNESIEAISRGFGQLSDVVHQNSATAEESAAATQQMSSQTSILTDLVSRFKTGDGPMSCAVQYLAVPSATGGGANEAAGVAGAAADGREESTSAGEPVVPGSGGGAGEAAPDGGVVAPEFADAHSPMSMDVFDYGGGAEPAAAAPAGAAAQAEAPAVAPAFAPEPAAAAQEPVAAAPESSEPVGPELWKDDESKY